MRANSIGALRSAALVIISAAVRMTGVARSDDGTNEVHNSLAQRREPDAAGQIDRLGKTAIPGHTHLRNRTEIQLAHGRTRSSVGRRINFPIIAR